MSLPEILSLLMFAVACGALMAGYSVAFTLAGVSLVFAALGVATGQFNTVFLLSMPGRIFPILTREILMAIPLFVFMGVMLEKSRIAEELLESMGELLGPLRGGMGVSVIFVGALLAASTGIVGATVVTMGLISLPTLLRRGYDPALASGAIAASGTLGQIIPPSIVLVILGDQISNAYQEAQRSFGLENAGVVSVGDLFAGALIPGLILVGCYALYIVFVAIKSPARAPAYRSQDLDMRQAFLRSVQSMLPPIFLIMAVLGSILSGYATPTRGAALGALGAVLLAGYKRTQSLFIKRLILFGTLGLALLFVMDLFGADLRLNLPDRSLGLSFLLLLSFVFAGAGAVAALLSFGTLQKQGDLAPVSRSTLHITCMVFLILIGATIFSLVFRGFGGDDLVAHWLENAPGGLWGGFALVMLVMFVLGFFLDFIEITFVVVPLVAPPLLAAGFDPIWLGVIMALNLQTSFLTPPFGFALFYLRGVAPPEVTTTKLYKGVLPFIGIQGVVITLVILFPKLATALPQQFYG